MSDGKHKALRQAVQNMLNSMENLSVDAGGIARGSWVQAHLEEVQNLLGEAPQMPASGIEVGRMFPASVPAPEPKGFGLDAKIDNIMAIMPKDWNGLLFFTLISHMVETFISKNSDYAGNDRVGADALANFMSATELGVTPLKGILVRCQDKWKRIQNLTREERVGMVRSEAVEDTMLDLAVYMILAIMINKTTNNPEGE